MKLQKLKITDAQKPTIRNEIYKNSDSMIYLFEFIGRQKFNE